ncbi:MAG TPA: acyloxyacyl hydrolase [Burkholderiaceae bacterium]
MRPLSFPALAAGLALLCAFQPGHAADRYSLEIGAGEKVQLARVGLQFDSERTWHRRNGRHVGMYWDLTAAYWRQGMYRDIPGNKKGIADIGLTPVFRYQRDDKRGWYGEAAVGVHYLTELYDNDYGELSTRFQFGDHLAIGYVTQNQWDIALKFQHFSNGGIRKPNNGVNYLVLKTSRRF